MKVTDHSLLRPALVVELCNFFQSSACLVFVLAGDADTVVGEDIVLHIQCSLDNF